MTILPSTQLAELQDHILARTDYSVEEAKDLLDKLHAFGVLLASTHNSNLHVRNYVIQDGLIRLHGSYSDIGFAIHQFRRLCRDGYYSEGPAYFEYVKSAFDWHDRIIGAAPSTEIAEIENRYMRLLAPDQTIPVPEASDRSYPILSIRAPISDAKYIRQLFAWTAPANNPLGVDVHEAYLLIDVGTGCDPKNLHDWLSAGYFALMIDGIWIHRCRAYKSFSWGKILDDSWLTKLLPKGALLPGWRLKPPRVSVVKDDPSVTVKWNNGPLIPNSSRTISWGDGAVRVADKWGWFGRRVREWRVG